MNTEYMIFQKYPFHICTVWFSISILYLFCNLDFMILIVTLNCSIRIQ